MKTTDTHELVLIKLGLFSVTLSQMTGDMHGLSLDLNLCCSKTRCGFECQLDHQPKIIDDIMLAVSAKLNPVQIYHILGLCLLLSVNPIQMSY